MSAVDQDAAPWRAGVARAREAIEQGLADLEEHLAHLENDPRSAEADVNFARYAIERYREVLG